MYNVYRKAQIPCVIVEGYAKGADYKVGDSEEALKSMRTSWNAVYCDGYWRLVFPHWDCSALVGHSTGAFTLVEAGGENTYITVSK